MDENTLSNEEIQKMRAAGLVAENEIVISQGDLLVAVNVVTQVRRMLDINNVTEGINKKRLLKG